MIKEDHMISSDKVLIVKIAMHLAIFLSKLFSNCLLVLAKRYLRYS